MTAVLTHEGMAASPLGTSAVSDINGADRIIGIVVHAGISADPVVSVVAGVLGIPLDHLYALMLRAGLLKISNCSAPETCKR